MDRNLNDCENPLRAILPEAGPHAAAELMNPDATPVRVVCRTTMWVAMKTVVVCPQKKFSNRVGQAG